MLYKFKVNTLQILIELIFKLIAGRKPERTFASDFN